VSSGGQSRKACCVPAAPPASSDLSRPETIQIRASAPESAAGSSLILIPAQQFLMGSSDPDGFRDDGEGPPRLVTVDAFHISPTVVTNRQFADFVRATRYITDAERSGASFVFCGQLPGGGDSSSLPAAPGLPWWRLVEGAAWQRPEGPGSYIHDRPDYPVVHVSWFDAQAYCAWSGQRLPTEAQWECAARGGLQGKRYPWGDELMQDDHMRCNIWQGTFPDCPAAGWVPGPQPARSFEANGYGLYNTAGNVWEWCADAFVPEYHRVTSGHNPLFSDDSGYRSIRGGSFLCDASYCNRYRVGARNSSMPDSTTSNCGFRVVE